MSEAEAFLGLAPDRPPAATDVGTRRKRILVASAWIAGLLVAGAYPDPRVILLLPMLPVGSFAFFPSCGLKVGLAGSMTILVFAWMFFIALTITTLVVKNKKWFYACWTILAILLLLNAIGLHVIYRSL